ncbi:MAG: thioredoxin family protein [Candidatus Kapabacteria bacterium]|jgi:thiol-disulfide isomerase/thioredoxin|nr:thioredoxin family protein [Candidatus Kapabacteria bacterium]
MAEQSTMLPLGTIAPNFTLLDAVTGQKRSFNDLASSVGTVVMFICNHCPFVIRLKPTLAAVAQEYTDRGVSFIAINSNDIVNYPQDGPEFMKKDVEEFGYPFPFLFDETQEVARTFRAACTPDFYIFDGENKLVYRGQFDDSRPGNTIPVTGESLTNALDSLLEGLEVSTDQKPSIGCGIKWK